ncbi:hypothetical protein SCHIN_v1c01820 [Spiroplasma chinense]|uniref:Uncharacterized protein n=1 Tax=Spiroplasma chinense TaxID=216932 RepID=A0A5B9Y2W5_9MOLU|nr:hypothetical protein [Spiroplasma chinense]QEH61380.1 hypothetical protein SCHIN_v1c01820 [Spiroplasma chinense]
MKKSNYILAIVGCTVGIITQILSYILFKPIAQGLNAYDPTGHILVIIYITCNLIWLLAILSLIVFGKKMSVWFVGAIVGVTYAILVILFSWLLVTWIFWVFNMISGIILIIACILIFKENRDNL